MEAPKAETQSSNIWLVVVVAALTALLVLVSILGFFFILSRRERNKFGHTSSFTFLDILAPQRRQVNPLPKPPRSQVVDLQSLLLPQTLERCCTYPPSLNIPRSRSSLGTASFLASPLPEQNSSNWALPDFTTANHIHSTPQSLFDSSSCTPQPHPGGYVTLPRSQSHFVQLGPRSTADGSSSSSVCQSQDYNCLNAINTTGLPSKPFQDQELHLLSTPRPLTTIIEQE